MGRVADSFSDGKTVRVPPALVQPIFSDDVVAALADIVLGAPADDTLEVAGPEAIRFDELIVAASPTTTPHAMSPPMFTLATSARS